MNQNIKIKNSGFDTDSYIKAVVEIQNSSPSIKELAHSLQKVGKAMADINAPKLTGIASIKSKS